MPVSTLDSCQCYGDIELDDYRQVFTSIRRALLWKGRWGKQMDGEEQDKGSQPASYPVETKASAEHGRRMVAVEAPISVAVQECCLRPRSLLGLQLEYDASPRTLCSGSWIGCLGSQL